MEPKINGITGSYLIPHVPSKKYKFAEFLPFTAQEMTDGGLKKKSFDLEDIKKVIVQEWALVTGKAKLQKCNDYFKTLSGRKTLKEVLEEGKIDGKMIILHCLVEK
jgi:hypothetical protein